MGNAMYCVHCGVPRSHYANAYHAARSSCRYSSDRKHLFVRQWTLCCLADDQLD